MTVKENSRTWTSGLRRGRKHDIVVRDILAQILAGSLQPGDRLAPVSDLVAHYNVSQRTVLEALRILAGRGVIIKRQRSGCFIAPYAPAASSALPASSGANMRGALSARFRTFLAPCSKPRVLTIYLSELFDANLSVWRQACDDFSALHPDVAIKLLSCHDGHLEELYGRYHIDLMLTTPEMLAHLGAERFTPIALAECDLTAAELLPPVREYLEQATCRGAPCLLTVNYIYANLDLIAQAGIPPTPPATFAEFMQRAGAIAERLSPPHFGYAPTGLLLDELFATGSVRIDAEGKIVFDAARCRHCLESLLAGKFQLLSCIDVVPAFISGRLAYLWHCSFTAQEIAQAATFRWTTMPVPVANNSRLPGTLLVLAANVSSQHLDVCRLLIRHLLSLHVQKNLAARGGNLPVRQDAIFAPEIMAQQRVAAATLREALAYTTLRNADEARKTVITALTAFGPESLAAALYYRKIMPDEAAARLCALLQDAAERSDGQKAKDRNKRADERQALREPAGIAGECAEHGMMTTP